MESMSVGYSVLEAGGSSSNSVHSNTCPLGLWSVKLVSASLDRQSARTFCSLFMYCMFNLYDESSMNQLLTLLFSVLPLKNFSMGLWLQSIVHLASCKQKVSFLTDIQIARASLTNAP